ncbi:MAG: hypothetical protein JO081_21120 [Alphaproteobacteria bacterium]|nr:hypothetical protein [Alphaproteobacteria bacterium]
MSIATARRRVQDWLRWGPRSLVLGAALAIGFGLGLAFSATVATLLWLWLSPRP